MQAAGAAALDESRAKFERDMIELIKWRRLNEEKLQAATWSSGDLRKARAPVKRKGTAASASASGANATAVAPKPARQGKRQGPNVNGSIASVSVKRCKKEKKE